ncbi:MAG: Uma2 family endonuclease [Bacteroidota bacterium]
MTVQLAKRLINADEYNTMIETGILTNEDRVELIHGEILEMSPTGKKHRSTVIRVENKLKELFGNKALISVQNPININDLNEPEPDIAILKNSEDYYDDCSIKPEDIHLIIEVSDSTYIYDKEVKGTLYGSAGILEYWIIRLETKEIEVHTIPAKGGYKIIEIFYVEDQIKLNFCQKSLPVKNLIG